MSEYVLLRRKLYICTAVQAVKMNISCNPIEYFLWTPRVACTKIFTKIQVKIFPGTNGLR